MDTEEPPKPGHAPSVRGLAKRLSASAAARYRARVASDRVAAPPGVDRRPGGGSLVSGKSHGAADRILPRPAGADRVGVPRAAAHAGAPGHARSRPQIARMDPATSRRRSASHRRCTVSRRAWRGASTRSARRSPTSTAAIRPGSGRRRGRQGAAAALRGAARIRRHQGTHRARRRRQASRRHDPKAGRRSLRTSRRSPTSAPLPSARSTRPGSERSKRRCAPRPGAVTEAPEVPAKKSGEDGGSWRR